MEDSAHTPPLDARELLQRRAAELPGLISFAGGLPDPALFPKRHLSRAFLAAISERPSSALQYGWPEGLPELRERIAAELAERSIAVEPERIIVTSGAQQAIQIAASVVGTRPRIAVERESYPGALEIFRSARGKLVELEDDAHLYYVMPSVSNPRGQSMSATARGSLLARARACNGYIVEDDAYAGTRFDGGGEPPLLASAPERVFHVGTFSKTLCPGLRIGWLIPPRKLARSTLKHKQATDLQASSLSQALLADYLRTGDFPALQRRARARYRRKLRRLLAAVERELPQLRASPPIGGFSLWLESSLAIDDSLLLERAIEQGVSFDPGQQFRARPEKTLAFRLCFSAVPEDQIETGVARLARALKRLTR
jgi:2-aminoadipate transaminase